MRSSAARSVLSQAPPRRNEDGETGGRRLRWTLAASVAAGALALSALPAAAVTKGVNGTILFVANEPCNPNESFCDASGYTRAVFEMKADGSGVTKLWFQNYYFDSPSQAPDGSRLLVSSTFGDPEIYKVQRSSFDTAQYVTDGCGMSWAPDSGRIVQTDERGCYATLNLLTLPYPSGGVGDLPGDIQITSSSSAKLVAPSPADDRDPDWSPDGNWITFASNRTGGYQIWAAHPDGSGLHQVSSDGWVKSFPAFSPDSGRIVFTRSKDGASDLWSVKVDGTGLKQVTKTSAFETQATYSPDGSRLIVARQPSRGDQAGSALFRMRTDGTDVVQLTKVTDARWAYTDPFWTNVPKH